jgi:hypothetical protein
MENQFKQKELSQEQQDWIASEAIFRQESLTNMIEAQVEAIEAQTLAIYAQTNALLKLSTNVGEMVGELMTLNQRFAPCDFTQWNITEAITNLCANIEELTKK